MISAGRPDSVGGGGSSRNFPGSPLAGQIQWGGGVVAEIFRDHYKGQNFFFR